MPEMAWGSGWGSSAAVAFGASGAFVYGTYELTDDETEEELHPSVARRITLDEAQRIKRQIREQERNR